MTISLDDITDPLEPVYTFVDGATGKNVNIASARLTGWVTENLATLETGLAPVERRLAETFVRDKSISMVWIKGIAEGLRAKGQSIRALPPIIFAITGIGENGAPDVMLVDGHHRYALHAFAGETEIKAVLLSRAQWEPFQIEGLSDMTEDELRATPILKQDRGVIVLEGARTEDVFALLRMMEAKA